MAFKDLGLQPKRRSLSQLLLNQAANNRHGVTFEPQVARLSKCDIQGLFHVGVPSNVTSPWESAAGGVSHDEELAKAAAIGEAVERYSAANAVIESFLDIELETQQLVPFDEWPLFTKEQISQPDFPFSAIYIEKTHYVEVTDYLSGSKAYVPHALVVLRDDFKTGLPTSSGLAAAPTFEQALLSAILEVIERDALMVSWTHGLSPDVIEQEQGFYKEVHRLDGEVIVLDLTPQDCPFPVIAVIGGIPRDGQMRYSLGVACKTTYMEARTKAYYEWAQGVFFAGVYQDYNGSREFTSWDDVVSFDDHALYYTVRPNEWRELPFLHGKNVANPRQNGKSASVRSALRTSKSYLRRNNLRLYYRDLSSLESIQSGLRVVRALSPDMAMIYAHQKWPLQHKVDSMLKQRYPWAATQSTFPFNAPHPLG